MSEKQTGKQQYLEGPWQRVSGPEPLSKSVLEGWKNNLDNMYGADNWRAEPVEGRADNFDIVVSPDYDSVYAGVARKYDMEGKLEDPIVQGMLGKLALEETQRAQPSQPEPSPH